MRGRESQKRNIRKLIKEKSVKSNAGNDKHKETQNKKEGQQNSPQERDERKGKSEGRRENWVKKN